MRCPSCQSPNDADSRFCESCGAGLDSACAACGGALSPAARFCRHCGAAAEPAPRAGRDGLRPPLGERRQITALFCDLVGSTQLSHRLDPEELREIVTTYQAACARAVKQFEGHIAQYLGDGVLVYFGFPHAHEDDAERAVRAALAIQSELAELNRARAGSPILARIGIHSGLVVVSSLGGGAHRETLALGETINLAAQLEQLAPPGGVVISRATQRLVAARLATREVEGKELDGIWPVRVESIDREAIVRDRTAHDRAVSPLVGRDPELATLLEHWRLAQAGQGQVLAISGEAGIGKTRLLEAFRDRISGPHTWLDLRCSPYRTGSAFQPVIELFERVLFVDGDSAEQKLAKLERWAEAIQGATPEEVVPYLAKLLGVPDSARFPLRPMSADLQRERTLAALLAPMREPNLRRPAVAVCEDMHWCDHSTLTVFDHLLERAAELPVLVIMTFRPSLAPRWPREGARVHALTLSRLGEQHTREVIDAAAGRVRLPLRVVDELVARSGGIPLFALELVRSIIESGLVVENDGRYELRGRLADLAIPTTLRGSLMARLDRLSGAKQLAQISATLGREFSYPLIEAVADLEEPALRDGLARLVDAGVLARSDAASDATYSFTHVLLQDTAYESQLKSRRRELHARTAAVLAERFAAHVASEPEIIARHCAEGGLTERAIHYYGQAGHQAIARLANAEALEYFGTALDLLATLPETEERNRLEVALRVAQSGPLAATGYERAETVANLARLETLCELIENGPARLPALVGLAVFNQVRGDLPRSRRWAEKLLLVAEPLGAVPLCVAGHAIIGSAALTASTIPEACEHLSRADALAREAQLPPPTGPFDIDVQALVAAVRSLALVLNGEPELAVDMHARGMQRARQLGHVYTLAHNASTSSILFYFLDDAERTLEMARESLSHAGDLGFHVPESASRVFGGWARVRLGDATGIGDVERGIEIALGAGSRGGIVQLHIAAAEAFLWVGRFDRCDEFIDRAAAMIERTGERSAFEPQLLMLRAELILESGNQTLERARRLLLQSIDGWRSFESPWMELRSALLLGELALRIGGKSSARARIVSLCRRFREGFGTERLQKARRLAESLAT